MAHPQHIPATLSLQPQRSSLTILYAHPSDSVAASCPATPSLQPLDRPSPSSMHIPATPSLHPSQRLRRLNRSDFPSPSSMHIPATPSLHPQPSWLSRRPVPATPSFQPQRSSITLPYAHTSDSVATSTSRGQSQRLRRYDHRI